MIVRVELSTLSRGNIECPSVLLLSAVMLIVVMMGKWSDDSACCVVYDVRLYSVLDTVVLFYSYITM